MTGKSPVSVLLAGLLLLAYMLPPRLTYYFFAHVWIPPLGQ